MGFQLPDEYGYVVLAHCMSWISNMYLTFNVVPNSARRDVLSGTWNAAFRKFPCSKEVQRPCCACVLINRNIEQLFLSVDDRCPWANTVTGLIVYPDEVKARKQYNVSYPALYAPESHTHAEKFNSVQSLGCNTIFITFCLDIYAGRL